MATWASLSVALDSIIKLCKVSSFLFEKEQNIVPCQFWSHLMAFLLIWSLAWLLALHLVNLPRFETLQKLTSKTQCHGWLACWGLIKNGVGASWGYGWWVHSVWVEAWSLLYILFSFQWTLLFFVCCANDIISWDSMSFIELPWLSCCDWHQLLLLWLSENLFLPI